MSAQELQITDALVRCDHCGHQHNRPLVDGVVPPAIVARCIGGCEERQVLSVLRLNEVEQ